MEGIGGVLNACVVAIALGVILKGLVQTRGKSEQRPEEAPSSLIPKAFSLFRRQKREGNPLKVLGSIALGLRERLFLVEAEGRRFLVSTNRGQVLLLYVFPEGPKTEPQKEAREGAKAEANQIQDFAFPFPLPLDGGGSNGSRIRPFSEVMREIEREYPFLKEVEGWER